MSEYLNELLNEYKTADLDTNADISIGSPKRVLGSRVHVMKSSERAVCLWDRNRRGSKSQWFPKSAFDVVENHIKGQASPNQIWTPKAWFVAKMNGQQKLFCGLVD